MLLTVCGCDSVSKCYFICCRSSVELVDILKHLTDLPLRRKRRRRRNMRRNKTRSSLKREREREREREGDGGGGEGEGEGEREIVLKESSISFIWIPL